MSNLSINHHSTLSYFALYTCGMARDALHDVVRNALEKDGWTITDDPLRLVIGRDTMYVDLAAERLIAATRGEERIAVEVKGFTETTTINGFHGVLGQYINYRLALRQVYPQYRLYLAVPEQVFMTFFQRKFASLSLEENKIALLVYSIEKEAITHEVNP
jgi:XisH protein